MSESGISRFRVRLIEAPRNDGAGHPFAFNRSWDQKHRAGLLGRAHGKGFMDRALDNGIAFLGRVLD
jgi:hypothetical protein